MKIYAILLVALLAALTCGCVTHSAGIAPSSMPLKGDYDRVDKASGNSWGITIFFIPIKQAKTAQALERAIDEGGGDALVQVTVDNRDYFLLFVYLQRIRVQGMGVKSH